MKHIIGDWRQGLKFYSVWIFALIALLPDIYSAIVAMGLLEAEDATSTVRNVSRGLAAAGIISRFLKQAKPPCDPVPPEPSKDAAS